MALARVEGNLTSSETDRAASRARDTEAETDLADSAMIAGWLGFGGDGCDQKNSKLYADPNGLTLEGKVVPLHLRLLLEESGPVLEATSRSERIDQVTVDAETGIITYVYTDGSSWEVTPDNQDYATHLRLASGEMVVIGREFSNRVYCTYPFRLIEGESGKPVNRDQLYFRDTQLMYVMKLLSLLTHYRYEQGSSDSENFERSGTLSLTLSTGQDILIDSEREPELFTELVKCLVENIPIVVGYTSNGINVYFSSKTGIITGDFERNMQPVPKILINSPFFSKITPGNFYTYYPESKRIGTYLVNRLICYTIKDPEYLTLQALINGATGYIPYLTEAGVLRVFVVRQSPQEGIWIDDYAAQMIGDDIRISWPQDMKPAVTFAIPVAVSGISIHTQNNAHLDTAGTSNSATNLLKTTRRPPGSRAKTAAKRQRKREETKRRIEQKALRRWARTAENGQ